MRPLAVIIFPSGFRSQYRHRHLHFHGRQLVLPQGTRVLRERQPRYFARVVCNVTLSLERLMPSVAFALIMHSLFQ